MPQLDPNPWFMIMSSSWIILFMIILPKTMAHEDPNELTPGKTNPPKAPSWNWT